MILKKARKNVVKYAYSLHNLSVIKKTNGRFSRYVRSFLKRCPFV